MGRSRTFILRCWATVGLFHAASEWAGQAAAPGQSIVFVLWFGVLAIGALPVILGWWVRYVIELRSPTPQAPQSD